MAKLPPLPLSTWLIRRTFTNAKSNKPIRVYWCDQADNGRGAWVRRSCATRYYSLAAARKSVVMADKRVMLGAVVVRQAIRVEVAS